MAEPIWSAAEAPEESADAPAAEAAIVVPLATRQEPAQTAASQAEAPRRTFEDWARGKHPCAVDDETGRAKGVVRGKRQHRKATRNAAIVNAARSYQRIPVGRLMTEAEYDEAIAATRSIVIK